MYRARSSVDETYGEVDRVNIKETARRASSGKSFADAGDTEIRVAMILADNIVSTGTASMHVCRNYSN